MMHDHTDYSQNTKHTVNTRQGQARPVIWNKCAHGIENMSKLRLASSRFSEWTSRATLFWGNIEGPSTGKGLFVPRGGPSPSTGKGLFVPQGRLKDDVSGWNRNADATSLDEVVLLETQVLCHSMNLTQSARGFLTTLHSTPLPSPGPAPVQYQHGEHEDPPPCNNLILEGALPAFNAQDPLFLHFIPEEAPKLQCTRCWSERTSAHEPDNPWEQLWAGCCLCSGHWMPRPLYEAPFHLRP